MPNKSQQTIILLQETVRDIESNILNSKARRLTRPKLSPSDYLFLPNIDDFKNSFGSYNRKEIIELLELYTRLIQLIIDDKKHQALSSNHHQARLLQKTTPSKCYWENTSATENTEDDIDNMFRCAYQLLEAASIGWSFYNYSNKLFTLVMRFKVMEWQLTQPTLPWEKLLTNIESHILDRKTKSQPLSEMTKAYCDNKTPNEHNLPLIKHWANRVFEALTDFIKKELPDPEFRLTIDNIKTYDYLISMGLMHIKSHQQLDLDTFDQWLTIMLLPLARSSDALTPEREVSLAILELYFNNRRKNNELMLNVLEVCKEQLEGTSGSPSYIGMKSILLKASQRMNLAVLLVTPSPRQIKETIAYSAPVEKRTPRTTPHKKNTRNIPQTTSKQLGKSPASNLLPSRSPIEASIDTPSSLQNSSAQFSPVKPFRLGDEDYLEHTKSKDTNSLSL